MTQQASIPLRQLLSKDLKSNVCGPNLTWSRAYASSDKEQSKSDRVRKGALAIFLFDGTFFKCKAKFPAQDISSIFFDSWFTRELLQPPFSQAARRVMFCPHIVSCICDRREKELKALHKALASRALISPSRLIQESRICWLRPCFTKTAPQALWEAFLDMVTERWCSDR